MLASRGLQALAEQLVEAFEAFEDELPKRFDSRFQLGQLSLSRALFDFPGDLRRGSATQVRQRSLKTMRRPIRLGLIRLADATDEFIQKFLGVELE